MKVNQIRDMDDAAINEEIAAQVKELMEKRMGHVIGLVENPLELRHRRRAIARMKTVLRERELNSASGK